MKMRVLNLIVAISGGGAERQLSYLANNLARKDYEVHVGYLQDGPNPECITNGSVKLHKLKHGHDPRILWHILRLVKNVKPDFVHTWIMRMDILGGIVACLTKTPWVLREANCEDRYAAKRKYKLRVAIARKCNLIVSNSKGGDSYWGSIYPKKARAIIRNGFPLEQIKMDRHECTEHLLRYQDENFLLYVGRLEPHKGVSKLIEAWAMVMKEVPVSGVICGNGSNRYDLEKQIRRAGLSGRIRMVGYLPAQQVWSLMKRAAVFSLISTAEGLPNAVIEAMTCGCPVVASDIPAHREFLNSGNSTLVTPYNARKIADAILATLNNPQETLKKVELSKETANGFSIGKMVEGYHELYREHFRV